MLACAELFINLLESKNLKYNAGVLKDGEVLVDFPFEGKAVKCIFAGNDGEYLSLYLVYEKIPEDKMADLIFLCNELNAKFKWVKFYVDKDGDLMLQDDSILTPETAAMEAFELLLRMISIGQDVKASVMRAIYA